MKYFKSSLALLFLSILLNSCASSGAFNAATLTEVQLSEADYEIIAVNVKGEASAGYILGVSGGFDARQIQTIALARISGSGMIYGEAIENLWENFRKEYGETEGRSLALINIRYDTEALNLILYTQPTVSVRADVIEFTE
ncbi:MAG TPA: DUF6567 family protein [Balneolaceae bacterium]